MPYSIRKLIVNIWNWFVGVEDGPAHKCPVYKQFGCKEHDPDTCNPEGCYIVHGYLMRRLERQMLEPKNKK